MCFGGFEVLALLAATAATATTAYSLANAPGSPPTPPPPPPPPVPPPPEAVPPPPAATVLDTSVAAERTRQRRARGVASTVLTSPLGIASVPTPLGGG